MVTMKIRKNKFLVILIVFMMLFSNFGYTIAAIASSDEFEVISNGFFKKDEVKFNAYFEDETGKQTTEITKDVNEKIKLVVEILPQVEGYLRSGIIKAVSSNDNDLNFRFASVTENLLEDKTEPNKQLMDSLIGDDSEEGEKPVENTVTEEPVIDQPETPVTDTVENITENNTVVENPTEPVENTTTDNTVVDPTEANTTQTNTIIEEPSTNTVVNETNTSLTDSLLDLTVNPLAATDIKLETAQLNIPNGVAESSDDTNTVSDNPLLDALLDENVNTIGTETQTPQEEPKTEEKPIEESKPEEKPVEEPVVNEPTTEPIVPDEDRLVDEDAIINEITNESRLAEEIRNAILDIKVASDSEISLNNIIKDTKIEIELEFLQKEKLNVEDLFKDIKLQMSGTFINRNLEEVKVGKEQEITVGWEYTKDFTLESEFTKFSPFVLDDIKGTIVENRITVTRNVNDEKYLPVKSTRLEIVVPKVNDKVPTRVDVVASKLMATRGEDSGYVTFTEANWKYNDANGMINIFVENDDYAYSNGTDEYIVIYRYEDYIEAENSNLLKNVRATVTEFSGTQNNTIVKEINNDQEIKVDVGELVTYSIGTSEDRINKAKIYANYNSDEAIYETLYTTQVNVNILTSDILQQVKLDCTKEVYKNAEGVEFEAKGIEYKDIKFNYAQTMAILSEGGEIVITNADNETLYVLNKDAVTKEEDCTITLNGAKGIYVYANNIAKNGTINFEITKAIKKCDFSKTIFKSITQIESKVSAEVKYKNIEERIPLTTIATAKDFDESKTEATLSIGKDTLSTMRTNNNVELKIKLNNEQETSDLYVNPSFEIVFPRYVKAVGIEAINLLNDCGLRVGDFETYTENDIVKMRIDLEGTQTTFCENSATNGTNIIINANIDIDEYAPAREDQIKLYYCNEGVATYQSQTKWTISKKIPNDILKTTNGFDVQVIKYQAPTGLVTINSIVNYDGKLGEVKSVKQGVILQNVPTNSVGRIATMELLALNNTGNTCSDVVLLGRVPFPGIKDVITGEDIGTTTNSKMMTLLKEDVQNSNTVDIYYSTNPEADKNLDNIGNGWMKEVADMSTIRSFLIVVKGSVDPGASLRYTYDFEIPENLPYEAKIAGSFGGFYNNRKEEAVVFENTVADEVGLQTEAGPKLEVVLDVDIGDGVNVGECRFIKYTVKATNIGSMDAENVTITAPVPEKTTLYEYTTADWALGNNNYLPDFSIRAKEWKIDKLAVGESEEHTYMVKTRVIEEEGDTIRNKATVTAENLGITAESKEIVNPLIKSNFDIEINSETVPGDPEFGIIDVGKVVFYHAKAINISGQDLQNVKIVVKIPEETQYKEIRYVAGENKMETITNERYNENTHEAIFEIPELLKSEGIDLQIDLYGTKGTAEAVPVRVGFTAFGKEEATETYTKFAGPAVEVKQGTNADMILEGEHAEFAIEISNKGAGETKNLKIKSDITGYVKDIKAEYTGNSTGQIDVKDGKIEGSIIDIPGGGKVVVTISATAMKLQGDESEYRIRNQAEVTGDFMEPIMTDLSEIIVRENPNGVPEEPDEPVIDDPTPEYPEVDPPVEEEPDPEEQPGNQYEPKEPTTPATPDEPTTPNNSQNSNNNQNSTSQPGTTDNKSNNQTNNTQQPTNNQTNNNTSNTQKSENKTYSISGKVWLDANLDGKKDSNEESVSTIKVQLLKNGKMIKAITSNGNGEYKFAGLDAGKYNVVFAYDKDKYTTTNYNNSSIAEDINSDAVETTAGMASTADLTITDFDLNNIDLGLKLKDTFDLAIRKYVTKATVKTNKSTKEYNFNDERLSKVEIRSKEIEGATVDLEYKIVIENVGLVEGNATKVVDMIPEGMTFDEKQNNGWYMGNDGYLYNETLKDRKLNPEEKVELKLILSKVMNGNNVGVVSNKVVLQESSNASGLKDSVDNNVATQEIFITIGTGGTTPAIIGSVSAVIIVLLGYMNRNKVQVLFNKKYNNKSKEKTKLKKVYR